MTELEKYNRELSRDRVIYYAYMSFVTIFVAICILFYIGTLRYLVKEKMTDEYIKNSKNFLKPRINDEVVYLEFNEERDGKTIKPLPLSISKGIEQVISTEMRGERKQLPDFIVDKMKPDELGQLKP